MKTDVKALRQRIKDLEALHEARAEMDRHCFAPEPDDDKRYDRAERRFNRLHAKLWPTPEGPRHD